MLLSNSVWAPVGRSPLADVTIVWRATSLLLIFCAATAWADEADRAFSEGRYADARRLWLPVAEAGERKAQFCLGRIYEEGLGVSKSTVQAYFWYNLAAVSGSEDYAAARDRLEQTMKQQEIDEANKMIDEWMAARDRGRNEGKTCRTEKKREIKKSREPIEAESRNNEGYDRPSACKAARIDAREELSRQCRDRKGVLLEVQFGECDCEDLSGRSDPSVWCDTEGRAVCESESSEIVTARVCE